ncbi:uncharacterized protein LOC113464948 [Ceratina calcarata]|uniref:Uncharacterized protein LOC113464948 n=1 Tax=Ceratina calcarata TaxID=156304 RepID=A0AAJ7S9W9_9HYME|nr:uncharacterized protein LOC113464948 [Ceratina calcarata]
MIIRASQIFLVFVLSASSIYTDDSKGSKIKDRMKPVKGFIEESSSENQVSTTTESTTTAEELTSPVNVSSDFRPSVHLGEIKESRINTSPFNDLQHFKISNTIDPDSLQEHLKDYRVIFQPNIQTLTEPVNFQTDLINPHQIAFQGPSEEERNNAALQNNYVKFENEASNVQHGSKDQNFQHFDPTVENGAQYDLMNQPVYHNQAFDQETYLGKPSKFQEEKPPANSNADRLKLHNTDHQYRQPGTQNVHFANNPSNGMVYVQESSFMRTRKFPYSMWPQFHPEFNDSLHPVRKKTSPWRKILHLIGAFLPLGLLIAALTPNVVKVDNATQPNIVLSKWRVADLPAEHKRARFTDTCEERSICEMILAGGDAGSTALQNILWNLATRTSSTMAEESGLLEIFESVKKKDCDNVPC